MPKNNSSILVPQSTQPASLPPAGFIKLVVVVPLAKRFAWAKGDPVLTIKAVAIMKESSSP